MNGWSKIGLPLTALTAIGLGFFGVTTTSSITACSSSSSSSGGSSGSGSGGTGAACPSPLPAGTFAPGNCVTSDESKCAPTTCAIDAKCGSTSTCEPLADNKGKTVQNFRIRRLTIIAPTSLANQIIQDSVVSLGVNINALECGSKGDGSFSWMISLDTANNTITTGGAPPTADPFGVGYCFVKTTTAQGAEIAPVKVAVTKAADGTYESGVLNSLNIPIFYQPGPKQQIIVLPINGGAIKGMQVSADGNCVGAFNPQAINGQCYENDPNTCAAWHTGGSLGGYITLEGADSVPVPLLSGHSLCTLLTGMAPDANGKCPRTNGVIDTSKAASKPDFCSRSGKAGDCADSYWLAATFAASAATITDGAGVDDCNGSKQPGGDAGPGDSGTD